jgi:hypothetical protein
VFVERQLMINRNSNDQLMADNPKFDYGDEVQVSGGEHNERMGSS